MRIKGFTRFVDKHANPLTLRDSSLVIDAHNFFYNCYKDSNLRVELGAECDGYADYLRNYLSMFKEENIQCYFIFKGGTKDIENKIRKDQTNPDKIRNSTLYDPFTPDVQLQVLQEMKFDYVFTEYEAKSDCIALAKKLSCPVLSMDIEFAFSGVAYIPRLTLYYDKSRKILHCKTFSINNLLKQFKLNEEKLAMFILLTDETYFNENTFNNFFYKIRISQYCFEELFLWLSKTPKKIVLHYAAKYSNQPKKVIYENLRKAKTKHIEHRNIGELAINYFLKKEVTERWFEAGVTLNIIAKPYIDLYRSNTLLACNSVDEAKKHPILLSFNIIKYALDLLTDFQNDGFKFIGNRWQPNSQPVLVKDSIKKPAYQATVCVFEKGWDDIGSLGLFQHFMIEEVNFNFDKLEKVPADAKLLLIALVYFQYKKKENTYKIAYGIILSYAVLGVLNETVDKVINGNFISASDCMAAKKLLNGEVLRNSEAIVESLRSPHHPLVEFQHCLHEINYLNKLCGSPFEQTLYAKTFNGTFANKIVCNMGNEDEFINKTLAPVPTVLNFVNNIIELYKNLIV